MKISKFPKTLSASPVMLALLGFSVPSQASLTDIGNGLIYDEVSNVTWISDGYAFTKDIAATTANPTADPYTGALLGVVVTPPVGAAHTIAADDISYVPGLGRWMGSWWAASAWADNFSYQYANETVSDWRLPTSSEAQNLISQLGSGYGAIAPFTWLPPFYWTSNVTSDTNADVARPAFGTVDNFTLMNGSIPRYSNVLAVVPGNVAAVPVPGAMWLFASAVIGLAGLGRRKSA